MRFTLFALLFIILYFPDINACSSIVLKSENSLFLAKNFDWTYGDGYMIKNLRGINKKAFNTSTGTPVSWTSKYGSISFNQNGKEMPYGGMNEKGLTIEMLWLDYTEYERNTDLPYLNELEWIQYQLDNFSTTAEVIENLNKISIIPFKGKIHFILADASGSSVVIEHLGGKISYEIKNPNQCQIITNYDLKTSLNWYSKKENRDKGNVPNALFRYCQLTNEMNKLNSKSDITEISAFKILDKIAIKKGKFKTYWSIVYDINKRIILFKSFDSKLIKHIALEDLNFDSQTQGCDVNIQTNGSIEPFLIEFDPVMNTQLITKSFNELGLDALDYNEISKHQFDFVSPESNSYNRNYTNIKINITESNSKSLGRLGIVIINNDADMKNFKPFRDGMHQIFLTSTSYSWIYYGLPKGNYAIAAAQDKNNNNKADFEYEPYAFSNEKRAINGTIPSFEDCKSDYSKAFHVINLILK